MQLTPRRLLQQAPRLSAADAGRLARNLYGLDAAATPLPSERDQNFLLRATGDSGTGGLGTHDRGQNTVRYVLKIANATEDRARWRDRPGCIVPARAADALR